MRGVKKALFFVGVLALIGTSALSFAQANDSVFSPPADDVAIFDNQTDDFLLPSYFDAPPTVAVPTEAVPPSPPNMAEPSVMTESAVQHDVPSDVDILAEIFGDQNASKEAVPQQPTTQSSASGGTSQTHTFYPTPKSIAKTDSKPLLTPLVSTGEAPEPPLNPPRNFYRASPYATKLLAKESGKSNLSVTLPKDIRLQFLPHRTQLTEAAVKWISAYALHVQKDPRLMLTLRVSNKDWSVQQARLSLIMQIVFEQGLPTRQLQIFQSDRDSDTLIIGTDDNPNQTQIVVPGETKRVIKEQKTLSW